MAFKKICDECKKVIEGLSERQAEYLFEQHLLTHRFNEREKQNAKPTTN